MRFRERTIEGYPELFGGGVEQEGEYTSQANFGRKWGWYQSIYALAKGDVSKFDEVTSLNVFKCLNYLTFEKEKNELESAMIKKYSKR